MQKKGKKDIMNFFDQLQVLQERAKKENMLKIGDKFTKPYSNYLDFLDYLRGNKK